MTEAQFKRKKKFNSTGRSSTQTSSTEKKMKTIWSSQKHRKFSAAPFFSLADKIVTFLTQGGLNCTSEGPKMQRRKKKYAKKNCNLQWKMVLRDKKKPFKIVRRRSPFLFNAWSARIFAKKKARKLKKERKGRKGKGKRRQPTRWKSPFRKKNAKESYFAFSDFFFAFFLFLFSFQDCHSL